MKNYDSMNDAVSALKDRGYDAEFETQEFCLYCGDLDMRLNPESFNVDEVYRFDGAANPDDRSVVYAITSTNGVKGTLVDSQSPHAVDIDLELAHKLRARHDKHPQ